jgi:hypothetical protein
MAEDNIRVYAVIFADFPSGSVSEAQWQDLTQAAKTQPLSSAVIAAVRAAQNNITASKRSQNAAHLRLYTVVGFEIDRDDVDDLLIVLNAQAVIHNVTGSNVQKFQGVLQAELRAAALGLGYTQVQAGKLSVIQAIATDRQTAIQQAQTYLANNAEIWYE